MFAPAARVGDMHTCPLASPNPHVGGPILPPGAVTVWIAGQPAARLGDMATCAGPPDVIAMGSFGVTIGGKPAARVGDMTAHGGVVAMGCPTVMIGDTGAGGATARGSATPAPGECLVGSSRRQMRRAAAAIIASTPDHPLRFLLDPNVPPQAKPRFKPQRGLTHAELIDRPDLVQMGHITSDKLGETERLMLQGAWENQLSAISIESAHIGGAVLEQEAIEIGGIAVDRRTAESWEREGLLPAGTLAAAKRVAF